MESSTQETQRRLAPLPVSIDLITRSTASALLLVYGLGFVILGFHDARYGVVQFSPFRARIVLVGFVFGALVALAAAAQHYGFAYFIGLEAVVKDSEPQRRIHRDVVLAAGYIYTAFTMATGLSPFLFHASPVQKEQGHVWRDLAFLALLLLGFAIFALAGKTFSRNPLRAVFLSIFAFVLVLGVLMESGVPKPMGYLTAMLAFVGLYVFIIKRAGSALKYAADFRSWYLVLAILWIYISQIFNNLPPRWGGGQPTPVVIFQTSPAPWSPSNPMDALLLDETDQGLYVLLSPAGKAFFVPRGNVESVFFGSKEDLPKR